MYVYIYWDGGIGWIVKSSQNLDNKNSIFFFTDNVWIMFLMVEINLAPSKA